MGSVVRPAQRARACALLALLAGCAAQPQTAPVYRQAEPTASPEAAVREDFDPARFRTDLLLIDPAFAPPAVETVAPAPAAAAPEIPAPVLTAPMDSTAQHLVYRVQVIALSREDGARRIADEMTRRFAVPAHVVTMGHLFAVRAGLFTDAADAGELKGRIATLSQGYTGAFVMTDSVAVTIDAPPADGADASLELDGADSLAPADTVDANPDTSLTQAPPELNAPEPELVRTRGWRVLIEQFSTLDAARDYRGRVMARLRRDDVDVRFETPWYKVLAGSFRTSTEAQRFAERCRTLGYRNAAKVPGEVFLPREGQP